MTQSPMAVPATGSTALPVPVPVATVMPTATPCAAYSVAPRLPSFCSPTSTTRSPVPQQSIPNAATMASPLAPMRAPTRERSKSPSRKDAFKERLLTETQEARIRNLEHALDSSKAQHTDEVTRLQASNVELRKELDRLRTKVVERDQTIEQLRGGLCDQTGQARERDAEARRLQGLLESRAAEVTRLSQQMKLLMDQLREAKADADAARRDKETNLAPLNSKVKELTHALAVSTKKAALMNEEVETATRRVGEARAEAIDRLERSQRVEEETQIEVARKDLRIQQLQDELQTRVAEAAERERRLTERCRLLQGWCFRIWWSLDSNLDPGLVAAPLASTSNPQQGAMSSGTSMLSEPVAVTKLRLRQPIPQGWIETLRFQSTLFHWLSAETAIGRSLTSKSRGEELETAIRRASAEVKARGRQLHMLLQAQRDVERSGWQREREQLKGRVISLSERLGDSVSHASLDAEAQVSMASVTAELSHVESRLSELQLLQPIEDLLLQLPGNQSTSKDEKGIWQQDLGSSGSG